MVRHQEPMTDEEVINHYNRMVEIYGLLPDPEQEPIRFAYYVKLYKQFHLALPEGSGTNQG